MQKFTHEGFDLAYLDEGEGPPVLLIHGFASSARVNWVSPGWVRTLNDHGYRTIAIDNRGHGASSVSYDPADYTPSLMAGDAAALLDHLGIERAHVMGYSMGARISAFLALEHAGRVASVILGGLGSGMYEGLGKWNHIAEALLAEDPATISDGLGQRFRKFADQTGSDRRALAACIETSRQKLDPEALRRITQPALVAVGTTDDIAGAPEPLAALLPAGESFAIEGRDHMLSVGDPKFKRRAVQFLREHPL